MKAMFSALLCASSLNACQAPTTPEPRQEKGVHIPSAAEISGTQEQHYAAQLPLLQARNASADANASIQQGKRYFLCNAGRSTTVPGIAPDVYAQVRDKCPTECLEGVTDAIYGENHRRYLTVALDYAAQWNRVMLAVCR
ncbi:MAG: hypothetical protein BWK73_04250 [Thiothrix lacustris]|uniref:Uncharacterized protein n=1 Tax=Thiothrix lacustris TaxID=525917 RepID=A0A1Y1QXR8_9GAMM|nr:MAG: hypothetical protein BWK73_04250 [Thiothrix lacustris]